MVHNFGYAHSETRDFLDSVQMEAVPHRTHAAIHQAHC